MKAAAAERLKYLSHMYDPGPLEVTRRIWTSSSIRQATLN